MRRWGTLQNVSVMCVYVCVCVCVFVCACVCVCVRVLIDLCVEVSTVLIDLFHCTGCADLYQQCRARWDDTNTVPENITHSPPPPPPAPAASVPQSLPDAPGSHEQTPSASPPPVLDALVDMGFPTAHIRIALDR